MGRLACPAVLARFWYVGLFLLIFLLINFCNVIGDEKGIAGSVDCFCIGGGVEFFYVGFICAE